MKNRLLFIICALLMLILGTSDALRGIFSPLFLSSFGFSEPQLGVIVSASYFGNLVFLLIGGTILDKIGLKKSMMIFTSLLSLSLVLLILGNIYAILLIGFFLTLGLSTLLNTSINILSDSFSTSGSLKYLNILFFIQGIGTSGSQFLLSPLSESKGAWTVTLLFLSILTIPLIFMTKGVKLEKRIEDAKEVEKGGKIEYLPLLLLILSLSFYTIAEHGVTNYVISYGRAIGFDSATMGRYLALYSLGIMSGRLILGSQIEKIGEDRMILLSLALGTVLFFITFAFSVFALTFFMGFAISTLYPTLVAFSRRYVPSSYYSRVTTRVVSLASIFDIAFNFSFGFAIENIGFRLSMMALPLAMLFAFLFACPLSLNKRR